MAWDGKPYSVERKGRPPITIVDLLIGITGGLQPDKLGEVFKEAADGMSARFLYAWPRTPAYRPLTDAPETDADMMDILDKLDRLAETADTSSRHLPLTAKARAALERYRKRYMPRPTIMTGGNKNGGEKAQRRRCDWRAPWRCCGGQLLMLITTSHCPARSGWNM